MGSLPTFKYFITLIDNYPAMPVTCYKKSLQEESCRLMLYKSIFAITANEHNLRIMPRFAVLYIFTKIVAASAVKPYIVCLIVHIYNILWLLSSVVVQR